MGFDTQIGRRGFIGGMAIGLGACATTGYRMPYALAPEVEAMEFTRYDERLDNIIWPGSKPEVIATGLDWIEGPTWDTKRGRLMFNDIPQGKMYIWNRAEGLGIWREPSGSGNAAPGVKTGVNGMLYLPDEDAILACDQDSRSILKYHLAKGPNAKPDVIARGKPGESFNSPNDLVRDQAGVIYFTDPPYGIDGDDSPLKQRKANGVYALAPNGKVTLIDGSLDRPNGIGLSPDEQYLYIANSGASWPRLVRYRRTASGFVKDNDVWYDARVFRKEGTPGGADGMAISKAGTIFATVPGGLAIFSPEADLLGYLSTNRANGNCCFGEDGKTLFLLSDDLLMRWPMQVTGLGF